MTDDTAARSAGKHEQARQLAEQAVRTEAEGDIERARDLFAAATRIDATAVADVLQQEDALAARAPRSRKAVGIPATGNGVDSKQR